MHLEEIAVGGLLATLAGISIAYDIENTSKLLHICKGYGSTFILDVLSKYKKANKLMAYAQPLLFEMLQEGEVINGSFSSEDIAYDWLGATIYYSIKGDE